MLVERTLLTQDPIGLAGGVNLYAYAGNNPVGFADAYGLAPACVPCLRALTIGLTPGAQLATAALLTLAATQVGKLTEAISRVSERSRARDESPAVFHRRAGATETSIVRLTGELQGSPPRNTYQSDLPAVKAYSGPLPAGVEGYEFVTSAVPDPNSPGLARVGGQVNWREGAPGVRAVDDETVAISVTITKERIK